MADVTCSPHPGAESKLLLALLGWQPCIGVPIPARRHGVLEVVAYDDMVRAAGSHPAVPGVCMTRACGCGAVEGVRVMQVRRLLCEVDGRCYLGLVLVLLGRSS